MIHMLGVVTCSRDIFGRRHDMTGKVRRRRFATHKIAPPNHSGFEIRPSRTSIVLSRHRHQPHTPDVVDVSRALGGDKERGTCDLENTWSQTRKAAMHSKTINKDNESLR